MFLQAENADIYKSSEKQAKDVAEIIVATKATHRLFGNVKIIIIVDLLVDESVSLEKTKQRLNTETGFYLNTSSVVNVHHTMKQCFHFNQQDITLLNVVNELHQRDISSVSGKIPTGSATKRLVQPFKTTVIIYADSDSEEWTRLYEALFRRMGYTITTVIFDGFSNKTEDKQRISSAIELTEQIETLPPCDYVIAICLISSTYAFNPIKFNTPWGPVKPVDLIQRIDDRFPDSTKLILLDMYFKVSFDN